MTVSIGAEKNQQKSNTIHNKNAQQDGCLGELLNKNLQETYG
jgi:hypothetical protein